VEHKLTVLKADRVVAGFNNVAVAKDAAASPGGDRVIAQSLMIIEPLSSS